ncbi:MAG: alkaline shock response membrane anchor protein AmaP [Chloroflexi bacterium]|nr:alkaline shock response membrane anchor protein AmaP [Chloroflexota bacterium]
MGVFNRLLIILLALVVLVAAGAVLLTALGVIQPAQIAASSVWVADHLAPYSNLDPTRMGWTIGICVVLMVLAIVLLVLELRVRRGARRITLKEDELGTVTVALDGVRELVDREAGQVAGVKSAHSHVEQQPQGLRIECQVAVDPASSVPDLTRELRERLKTAVQHHVGMTVTEVSVDAQVAPLVVPRRRRRVE